MSALSPKAEASDMELAPTQGRPSRSPVLQAKLYRFELLNIKNVTLWSGVLFFLCREASYDFVGVDATPNGSPLGGHRPAV